jgi:hypothetical protein
MYDLDVNDTSLVGYSLSEIQQKLTEWTKEAIVNSDKRLDPDCINDLEPHHVFDGICQFIRDGGVYSDWSYIISVAFDLFWTEDQLKNADSAWCRDCFETRVNIEFVWPDFTAHPDSFFTLELFGSFGEFNLSNGSEVGGYGLNAYVDKESRGVMKADDVWARGISFRRNVVPCVAVQVLAVGCEEWFDSNPVEDFGRSLSEVAHANYGGKS